MAQLFPDDILDSPDVSPLSLAVLKIFEQNLSDEWNCHAILDGCELSHLIMISPDLGLLILLISNCNSEQFNSFFQETPKLQQDCLDAVRVELQKNEQLCDESGILTIPLGTGILFTELSSDELNLSIGALSQFSIFSDQLNGLDDELEDLLFGMVQDDNLEELAQDKLDRFRSIYFW